MRLSNTSPVCFATCPLVAHINENHPFGKLIQKFGKCGIYKNDDQITVTNFHRGMLEDRNFKYALWDSLKTGKKVVIDCGSDYCLKGSDLTKLDTQVPYQDLVPVLKNAYALRNDSFFIASMNTISHGSYNPKFVFKLVKFSSDRQEHLIAEITNEEGSSKNTYFLPPSAMIRGENTGGLLDINLFAPEDTEIENISSLDVETIQSLVIRAEDKKIYSYRDLAMRDNSVQFYSPERSVLNFCADITSPKFSDRLIQVLDGLRLFKYNYYSLSSD